MKRRAFNRVVLGAGLAPSLRNRHWQSTKEPQSGPAGGCTNHHYQEFSRSMSRANMRPGSDAYSAGWARRLDRYLDFSAAEVFTGAVVSDWPLRYASLTY